MSVMDGIDLSKARAHWVRRDIILWNPPEGSRFTYTLHCDPSGMINATADSIQGGYSLPLERIPGPVPEEIARQHPHLAQFSLFKLRSDDLSAVPDILKGQMVAAARDGRGRLAAVTSMQIPGVLDDLYHYTGPLGVTFEYSMPMLRLWAPTARNVRLILFRDSSSVTPGQVYYMSHDPYSGVWTTCGLPGWEYQFYLYEVEVYSPVLGMIVQNRVTDPYSTSLSINSTRSQIVNLCAAELQPAGWASLTKPALDSFEDAVIYELHLRDFSAFDPAVPPGERGTYLAFTHPETPAMRHLADLAGAGLTHLHLLPVFDFATVDDRRDIWQNPDYTQLQSLPPDSDRQQEAVIRCSKVDGFNWGYDPFHYTTPEGSYSTNPDGSARIREFRQMVESLNKIGLRVVMDMVYNHTHASGQDPRSVLDRIVPGYYHRLDLDGKVENSTCCANTASEHVMFEKLMIDSLLTWATAYKVDGFRFDLMGHHMVTNLEHLRAALDRLTLERDGVDGKKIILYGECWDFGEVGGNARGRNASQQNMGGTGIGAFNDRLRDGVRGGTTFTGIQDQGVITGLFTDPNFTDQGSHDELRSRLFQMEEWIQLSLAGSLKEFLVINQFGSLVPGRSLDYRGGPAGYTQSPREAVNYVAAHDNETLFDAIQYKAAPSANLGERVRMNNLALDLVLLAQGIPFFQAGDDLLRSKSFDRNSYNSGDWFNRLDFSGQTSNYGIGLPPAQENRTRWDVMRSLLADPALKPGPEHIAAARAHFQEMLRVRKSSILFRLRTAEEVYQMLSFGNTGPWQMPGVILMKLGQYTLRPPLTEIIAVVFNSNPGAINIIDDSLAGLPLTLHPILAASADPRVRTAVFDPNGGRFTVPGRTTAVFLWRPPAE